MRILRQMNFSGLILMLVCAVLLAACRERQDDLNRYIAEVKERPATPIPPIPPVRTYTPYQYEGLTGRDPFRQSTSEGSRAGSADHQYRWTASGFATQPGIPGKVSSWIPC